MNNIFDINCKKVTAFYEKQSVFPLTTVEKCQMHFHVFFCMAGCKLFTKQSALIDRSMKQYIGNEKSVLSEESKQAILDSINKE